MTSPSPSPGPVRDRVLLAIADPDVASRIGIRPATLVAFQEPMAVFEWLGEGKGLVLLAHGGAKEDELAARLDHVLGAHEKGLLFVVVAGGGPEVAAQMRAADARGRNHDQVGLYHAEETGQIQHVVGRRSAELEKAGRALPECAPLGPEAIAAIAERGRQEREDATAFVRRTARQLPYATVAMLAICFLVYAITVGDGERGRHIYDLFRNDPEGIQRGELWRLFTYALLHDRRSPVHLLVNMISLYSLARFLEPLLGRWRLVLLFVLSALAGGVASALLTRAPSVGASGAVWGLLGGTFGLLRARHQVIPALIARILRQRFIAILVLSIAMSFVPGIDRYCHFGGGLAGYLIVLYYVRTSAKRA